MTLSTMTPTKSKTGGQSIRLYQTIADLPQWNWEQIKQTNDLRYLIKLEDYDELPEVEVEEGLWLTLQDEFKEKCGMEGSGGYYFDKVIDLWKLKRDMIIYSCDEYNSKLSKTKTKIKQLEGEIEDIPVSKQTIDKQVVMMEIFFKCNLNPRTTSVLRYNIYLNEYERQIEELQRGKAVNT